MKNWAEALLAIAVVVALGWALSMFVGDDGSTPPGGTTIPPVEVDPDSAARGAVIAESEGCLVCHSIDGQSGTGPTFKGLAGSNRPLTTGEFVRADDAYLRTAIVDPSAQIVDGFADVMPATFGEMLTDQDIDDLIAFIRSLDS